MHVGSFIQNVSQVGLPRAGWASHSANLSRSWMCPKSQELVIICCSAFGWWIGQKLDLVHSGLSAFSTQVDIECVLVAPIRASNIVWVEKCPACPVLEKLTKEKRCHHLFYAGIVNFLVLMLSNLILNILPPWLILC